MAIAVCMPGWLCQSSQAGLISASAEINLLAGPDVHSSTDPGTIVLALASFGGEKASSTADAALSLLGVLAHSNDAGLTFNSSSSAGYISDFTVFGLPHGFHDLPLSFNFSLHGAIIVSSGAPGTLAVGEVSYALDTSTTESRGSVTLISQNGSASSNVSGGFNNGFITQVGLTESQSISAPVSVPLSFTGSDVLNVQLAAFATSTVGASADVLYKDTLKLDSVTIPADFSGVDPSSLEVVFDSGLLFPVTRASVVPEPHSIWLFGAGLGLLVRRRKRDA